MELSKQLCTLEQAKRLKELGVIQESLFYHYRGFSEHLHGIVNKDFYDNNNSKKACYSAFTVAELGVILPHTLRGEFGELILNFLAPNEGNEYNWTAVYLYPEQTMCSEPEMNYIDGETESEVRAAMIIHLLEKGIITPEQVNASII